MRLAPRLLDGHETNVHENEERAVTKVNLRQFLTQCGHLSVAAGAVWLGCLCAVPARAVPINSPAHMLTLENADERHFVIRRDDSMYEEFPELCLLPSGKLLCVYKVGPKHGGGNLVILLESDDRGRTWKTLHEFSIECNMPRLQQLSDGRLWLDVDRNGKVLFSEDLGETWTEHNIGFGAHGHDRITELPDRSWINSTCEKTGGWNFRGTPLRIVQYRSTDKGRTWKRDAIVADLPGLTLSEATTVLLADGKLVSYIRESSGLSHGCVRAVSTDNGHTWKVDRAPFNFAMPRGGLLADGRVLVVGRNFAGNKSLYAWCDQPLASEGYKVQSMWAPDDSAVLSEEGLRIRCTDAKPTGAAAHRMITARQGKTKFGPGWEGLATSGIEPPVYILPAPRRRDSKVTIDACLRVLSNETGLACVISITETQEILFRPDRVEIFGQTDKTFKLDGTKFHDYRVVRDADSLAVFVDGTERIRTSELGRSRGVGYGVDTTHFGTSYRGFSNPFGSQDHFRRRAVVGEGESVWQRVEISVENPGAPNDIWSWEAANGIYPDQYQRDRIVEVKFQPLPNAQGGPSWVQFPDGEILVVHNGAMAEDAPKPFLMGCYLYPLDFKVQTPQRR